MIDAEEENEDEMIGREARAALVAIVAAILATRTDAMLSTGVVEDAIYLVKESRKQCDAEPWD